MKLVVRPATPSDAAEWDAFVERCADATFFHRFGWREIIDDIFRHRSHYLVAERAGSIAGILPLAEVRSRMFGHSLSSLPFCVYGGPAADDAVERVFEHVGATWARLTNGRLGVELTVRSSLPRLWQWVQPASGLYVLGIEPANCSVLGRAHDIAAGRMPFLDPGESRSSWLTIGARAL